MSFPRKLMVGGVLAISVVAAGGLLLWMRARQLEADRVAVVEITQSMRWWDQSKTETENKRKQVEMVRAITPKALSVFARDLSYEDPVGRWYQRLPWVRKFAGPNFDPESAENRRVEAAHWLGMLGPAAKPAVPRLIGTLDDRVERVSMTAALSLGLIGDASSAVIEALKRATNSSQSNLRISAHFALWKLTGSSNSLQAAMQAITNSPSWSSICVMRIGEPAKVFGPALIAARDRLPWGHGKMQPVEAHWVATRDKQAVLEFLNELAKAFDQPQTTNQAGWTGVEESVGYAAYRLDTEKEFRVALKPLLERIAANKNSPAQKMAQTYLGKHAELDEQEGEK
jgi:hypothetical protein